MLVHCQSEESYSKAPVAKVETGRAAWDWLSAASMAFSAGGSLLQIVPLPLVTLIYWTVSNRLFSRPLQMLSLKGAADLDRKDEVRSCLPAHPLVSRSAPCKLNWSEMHRKVP